MTFSRRHLFGFLTGAARDAVTAAGAGLLRPAAAESAEATAAIEAALEILAPAGPEYAGGLSNHGPMAADALVEMERPSAVVPWVERYRRGLSDRPRTSRPIDVREWRMGVGDWTRAGDWVVFFRREIADASWRSVLSEWTARLAPGASAAAFHGLLRTAHAARSLGRFDSPARRRELADGLAYWAARYFPIPDIAGWRSDGRLPSEALGSVAVLRAEEKGPPGGSISDALTILGCSPAFAEAAGLVDSRIDGSRLISDMAETFARVYLTDGDATPGSAIALLHAVTGPSAVRLLLPRVDDRAQAVLLRYVWQGAAALYAVYGEGSRAGEIPGAPILDRDAIIERAVESADEHAIKLTEVCLRENAVAPSTVFLAAAADGTRRFRRA